jgi:hypothetical protein
MLLDMPVYDTQCGAKLFRVTPRTAAVFGQPFRLSWSFDVELLSRYLAFYRSPEQGLDELAGFYEYALPEWRDVAGSKVVARDAARALLDLCYLYLTSARRLPRRRTPPLR